MREVVIIGDDEKEIARITFWLKKLGFNVNRVSLAQEILALKETGFEGAVLIVGSMELPDMNGFNLALEIGKPTPSYSMLPVIILADDSDESIRKAYTVGSSVFTVTWTIPIDPEDHLRGLVSLWHRVFDDPSDNQ